MSIATADPNPNGVDREYWENDLELNIEARLRSAGNSQALKAWTEYLTLRQLDVLCHALGITGASKTREKRDALAKRYGELTPFYLVEHFARRKSRFAVSDLATLVLDPALVEKCRLRKEGSYDLKALMYALFSGDAGHLITLFHLDKIHKSGFARMELVNKPRAPKQSFRDFLTEEAAREALVAFDRTQRDGRESQLRQILPHKHHHLVFIRRPFRDQYILREGRIAHGQGIEWIILDFGDNARRVNIASQSNEVPLKIANALASKYFEKPVEYTNERQVTYAQQIHRFLAQLKAGSCEELSLIDLDLGSSPVSGVGLRLSQDDPKIVQRAIADLERGYGDLTSDVDRISRLVVTYRGKRVGLRFDKGEGGSDEYIVRYMDYRLNDTSLRKQFEDFMRDTHGIPVLSTEKRFAGRR